MGIFDFILKKRTIKKEKLILALKNPHTIIDVRSYREFKTEHINGAINIPLQTINDNINQLKGKSVITCCHSGIRSKRAAQILQNNKIETINGGAWISLNKLKNTM